MTDPIQKAIKQAREINGDIQHVYIMHTHQGNVHCEFMDNDGGKFAAVGETMNDAIAAALHKMNSTQMPLF